MTLSVEDKKKSDSNLRRRSSPRTWRSAVDEDTAKDIAAQGEVEGVKLDLIFVAKAASEIVMVHDG